MIKYFILLVVCLMSFKTFADMGCVVLLHGLARTEKSMAKIEAALEQAGYDVVNYNYPSRKFDIPTLADKHIPDAVKQCEQNETTHFVTHSMGAIILRQYLEHHTIKSLNRIVMLAPPNQGSQVVDKLKNVPGFKFINGPAGQQLGTQNDDIPSNLGPAVGEVGIIAGTKSINLILSLYLPNPDDGKVSVENTKLVGMQDHITVDVSHPFIMKDEKVINQVRYFLSNGRFKR